MITSDKQFEAAKKQLKMLTKSLSSPVKKGVPAIIANAAKTQTQELIDELQAKINEYSQITEDENTTIEIHSLDDLLSAPIRYRLAAHMTIEGFGQKVGVSARQIARYEKEEYQNINTSTLKKILGCLDINIKGKITQANQKSKMRKAQMTSLMKKGKSSSDRGSRG